MDELPVELPDDWATLWFLVRRVASQLDRSGELLFRSELGVSLAQFLVLSVVDAHPGQLNQRAVADRLGLTKGTISRQIESAVAAGLMTAGVASHSRRENVVALTPEGTEIVRRGDAILEQSRHEVASSVSASDLAATLRFLTAISAQLDA